MPMTEDNTFIFLAHRFEDIHTEIFSRIQDDESVNKIFKKYGWTQDEYLLEWDRRKCSNDPYLAEFLKRRRLIKMIRF